MKKRDSIFTGKILLSLLFNSQLCLGLSVSSYVTDTAGITCTCNIGAMKIKVCQADVMHVMYSLTSSFVTRDTLVAKKTWPTPSFTVSLSGDTVTILTSRIKVKISKITANITYTDLNNVVILSEKGKSLVATTVNSISTNTVTTRFASPTTEGLYGLGSHMKDGTTNVVNYKGNNALMDQEYSYHDHFYTAVPVLVSTRGYGIYWDNYSLSNFYGSDSSNTQFRYVSECGDILDYYFFYGPGLDTVVANYRTATGNPPLLPKWAYGLTNSKDHYSSQSEYLAVKTGYRSAKIPVDCIVQDWQYWSGTGGGSMGCFCFTSEWTDVAAMIDSMHNANIHTMLSVWSEVQVGSTMYTTLNNLGALWTSDGDYHFIDSYDSLGRETFWNGIRDANFKGQGWDSWWLDNDEPYPYPSSFDRHSLTTAMGNGCIYYNTYSLMMSKMGYKNWRRDISGKRFLLLHRGNFAGQQAHASVTWNNDIRCTWLNLANSIPCGLNATILGDPYWCTDIGGYWGGDGYDFSTTDGNELFTRWFQYGAFQPFFRIHGNTYNNQGKELYQSTWTTTTKENLLAIDKLHYRLMPYLYSMAWMVTNQGYTPMRHLVMDFRTDANVKSIGDQYMFGPAFLVSPVTTSGATSRSMYLPAGKWYDFWSGDSNSSTSGRTISASAPLKQIPLYIRAGSIVPMGPEIQYATERADTIELRVYTGANGSFTLYEDEGDNYNYESGSYSTIPITYDNSTGKVTIGARSGSFTGMLSSRIFNIVFVSSGHGSDETKTTTPDCIVNYTGVAITACPVTGTINENAIQKATNANPRIFKVSQEKIVLSHEFFGRIKEVAVYDIAGKLLGKTVTTKQNIDLFRDFGLSKGVYVVHVNVVR